MEGKLSLSVTSCDGAHLNLDQEPMSGSAPVVLIRMKLTMSWYQMGDLLTALALTTVSSMYYFLGWLRRLTVQLWFLRQFSFVFVICTKETGIQHTAYLALSTFLLPTFGNVRYSKTTEAVREELISSSEYSSGEREETLPGGISSSTSSQRSTVSWLSRLLSFYFQSTESG